MNYSKTQIRSISTQKQVVKMCKCMRLIFFSGYVQINIKIIIIKKMCQSFPMPNNGKSVCSYMKTLLFTSPLSNHCRDLAQNMEVQSDLYTPNK